MVELTAAAAAKLGRVGRVDRRPGRRLPSTGAATWALGPMGKAGATKDRSGIDFVVVVDVAVAAVVVEVVVVVVAVVVVVVAAVVVGVDAVSGLLVW